MRHDGVVLPSAAGAACSQRQRQLYWEDNGQRVRQDLFDGGKDAQPLTEWVLSPSDTKDHTMDESWLVRPICPRLLRIDDSSQLRNRRDCYRAEYAAAWQAPNIDVLLCAPFAHPLARQTLTRRPSTGRESFPPAQSIGSGSHSSQLHRRLQPCRLRRSRFPDCTRRDSAVDVKTPRTELMSEADKANHEMRSCVRADRFGCSSSRTVSMTRGYWARSTPSRLPGTLDITFRSGGLGWTLFLSSFTTTRHPPLPPSPCSSRNQLLLFLRSLQIQSGKGGRGQGASPAGESFTPVSRLPAERLVSQLTEEEVRRRLQRRRSVLSLHHSALQLLSSNP